MPARDRCIARALFCRRLWHDDFGLRETELVCGIALGALDLIARELPRRHRIKPLDTLGDVTIGDTFDL